MHPATTPSQALERHVEFLKALDVLDARTPRNRDQVEQRFEAVADITRELRLERHLLRASIPVYWAHDTAEAAMSLAPSLDLSAIHCVRELVYRDRACCWFERPVISLIDTDGVAIPIQALSWWFVQFKDPGDGSLRAGLGITGWAHHVDDRFLTPTVWVRLYSGDSLDTGISYETDSYRSCAIACVRFVVAAGLFMRQRLAAVDRTQVQRHVRKRLAASGWSGDLSVDVIRLRARDTAPTDRASTPSRRYHWQWIVRAHVRQQWYPSLGQHLPILVSPHIKGPLDMPLKPRTAPLVVVDR